MDVIRRNSISQNARHTGHDQHYHSPSYVIQDENIIRENPVVKRHSIYQGDPSQRNTSVGLSHSTPYTSRVIHEDQGHTQQQTNTQFKNKLVMMTNSMTDVYDAYRPTLQHTSIQHLGDDIRTDYNTTKPTSQLTSVQTYK